MSSGDPLEWPVEVEKHPAGEGELDRRFPDRILLLRSGGLTISVCESDGRPYAILDEGTVTDSQGPRRGSRTPHEPIREPIRVYRFDSRASRAAWVRRRYQVLLTGGTPLVDLAAARAWLAAQELLDS